MSKCRAKIVKQLLNKERKNINDFLGVFRSLGLLDLSRFRMATIKLFNIFLKSKTENPFSAKQLTSRFLLSNSTILLLPHFIKLTFDKIEQKLVKFPTKYVYLFNSPQVFFVKFPFFNKNIRVLLIIFLIREFYTIN